MKSYILRLLEGNSFFLGIIMAFDLFGVVGSQKMSDDIVRRNEKAKSILNRIHPIEMKSDCDNLKSDLVNIGKDIRVMMESGRG